MEGFSDVGTILEGVKVGASVPVGVTVVFESTDRTQSAARQVAAQSSGRERPDIVSSALASTRKLQRSTPAQSLRPLRRQIGRAHV